nr:hypothetical protein CFP56_03079 [Quercus suber]
MRKNKRPETHGERLFVNMGRCRNPAHGRLRFPGATEAGGPVSITFCASSATIPLRPSACQRSCYQCFQISAKSRRLGRACSR